jgi:hypothetical protein
MAKAQQYVLCVRNRGYPAALDVRKVYRVLPDPDAAKHDMIRVIDESGEDYLYPSSYFLPIALPRGATRVFAKRSA